jgi:hypothetical protein
MKFLVSPRIGAFFRSSPVVYIDTDKGNRSVCQKMGNLTELHPDSPVERQAIKACHALPPTPGWS